MKNSHPLQPCPEHVYPFLEGNILVGNPHGKFPRSNWHADVASKKEVIGSKPLDGGERQPNPERAGGSHRNCLTQEQFLRETSTIAVWHCRRIINCASMETEHLCKMWGFFFFFFFGLGEKERFRTQKSTHKAPGTESQIPTIPFANGRNRETIGHHEQPLCRPMLSLLIQIAWALIVLQSASPHTFSSSCCCPRSLVATCVLRCSSSIACSGSHTQSPMPQRGGIRQLANFIPGRIAAAAPAQLPLPHESLHPLWREGRRWDTQFW